ncbi:MAG: glutathione S-transferase family protein [Pseudomonadota bacterium]
MQAHTAKPTLYAAWYCPFAQRAWLSLAHKGVPFDYAEIDPYDKTEAWMTLSRGHGQVPVLLETAEDGGEVAVPDSLRVMEYVDERFAGHGPALFPASPKGRAEARYWLDYIGRRVIPFLYRFLKAPAGSDAGAEARENFERHLGALVDAMDADGPFFFGAEPGVVDFALAPFIIRVELILSHYRGYRAPDAGPTWTRFAAWWAAASALPAVQQTSLGRPGYRERLVDFYVPYAAGAGQADITEVPT